MNRLIIILNNILLLMILGGNAYAQQRGLNEYGVRVITQLSQYKKITIADNLKTLVSIRQFIPTAFLDLRYADSNNFMHKKLYPVITDSYLTLKAATALKAVCDELAFKNYRIKIWDAYRPYTTTVLMWKQVMDERYAANPAFGSGHNKGIAVDLTLIDSNTGNEIDMGTGFDNFSDSAHTNFKLLPEQVLKNRLLLKTTMEKHGFKVLETEWWHFYLQGSNDFELLDLPFTVLDSIVQFK